MTKIEITNPDPAFPCVLATTDESTFLLIDRNQKPIRVETCNARSQLPNIQCQLIGRMFQC